MWDCCEREGGRLADLVRFHGKNIRFLVKSHFRASINVICQRIITGRYVEATIVNMRIFAAIRIVFVALSCKIFSAVYLGECGPLNTSNNWREDFFSRASFNQLGSSDSTIRMAGNPDRRLIMKKENPAFRAAGGSSNGGWRSSAGIRRLSLR